MQADLRYYSPSGGAQAFTEAYRYGRVRLADKDRRRITSVAVLSTVLNKSTACDKYARQRILDMVKRLGNLKELFVVEKWYHSKLGSGKRIGQDHLGYVDCDVGDPTGLGGISPSLPGQFDFKTYKQGTDNSGQNFSLDRIVDLKLDLNDALDRESRKSHPAWRLPTDIKIIRLVTQSEAQHVLRVREIYWRELAVTIRAEAECGPEPRSPWSARFADEHEVMEEESGAHSYYWSSDEP